MSRPPRPANARRFADQVAVVTGAAGGIGSAIAARLAAEEAEVWVCDVSADGAAAVAERIGGRALTFDLTDRIGLRRRDQATVAAGPGGIDVLVNNAGINRRGALLDLGPDDWSATFAVNVDAVVGCAGRCCR